VQLAWPGSVEWAPDSQSLLFTREPSPGDSKTELWLVAVRGGEPRKLGLTAKGMRDVSIHPDGRRVAFTSAADKNEVWAMENFLPGTK
jgi:dipeptidyl aminopeptidase/acylaminoacyl peptidase